jgi:hypothetical protein
MPTLSWSKDGVIQASGDTLTLTQADKTKAGKYTCTATNNYTTQDHIADADAYVFVTCE